MEETCRSGLDHDALAWTVMLEKMEAKMKNRAAKNDERDERFNAPHGDVGWRTFP